MHSSLSYRRSCEQLIKAILVYLHTGMVGSLPRAHPIVLQGQHKPVSLLLCSATSVGQLDALAVTRCQLQSPTQYLLGNIPRKRESRVPTTSACLSPSLRSKLFFLDVLTIFSSSPLVRIGSRASICPLSFF